jgi:1,4-dihydroxy-2-naphthoate polyprenyltransferase
VEAADEPRPRVALILGHPRADSFCAALADAYAAGAARAGVALRRFDLHSASFALDVTEPSPSDQALEQDLQAAAALIAWADHIVFVFPTWWGTMPARLKGFLDRILRPGFAFAHRADGYGWDQLLRGRTAQLLVTMDTPPPIYRWVYGAPGVRAMARATLGFCGIRTTSCRCFGSILDSTPTQRAQWLAEAETLGAAVGRKPFRDTIMAWLAALRLQFHPMAWIAYTLGAAPPALGKSSVPASSGLACSRCLLSRWQRC